VAKGLSAFNTVPGLAHLPAGRRHHPRGHRGGVPAVLRLQGPLRRQVFLGPPPRDPLLLHARDQPQFKSVMGEVTQCKETPTRRCAPEKNPFSAPAAPAATQRDAPGVPALPCCNLPSPIGSHPPAVAVTPSPSSCRLQPTSAQPCSLCPLLLQEAPAATPPQPRPPPVGADGEEAPSPKPKNPRGPAAPLPHDHGRLEAPHSDTKAAQFREVAIKGTPLCDPLSPCVLCHVPGAPCPVPCALCPAPCSCADCVPLWALSVCTCGVIAVCQGSGTCTTRRATRGSATRSTTRRTRCASSR